MRRIEYDGRLDWEIFLDEMIKKFGHPQIWDKTDREPQQLESNHQWARGRHRRQHGGGYISCVWVTDRIYTWYCLRWQ
jgi:hypothetical protein